MSGGYVRFQVDSLGATVQAIPLRDYSNAEQIHVDVSFRRDSLVLALLSAGAFAEDAKTIRARHLGVPFEGTPGPLNAITDVGGIDVGHVVLPSVNYFFPSATSRLPHRLSFVFFLVLSSASP
jgi:hypothetical protein